MSTYEKLISSAYEKVAVCKICGQKGATINPSWESGIGAELKKEGLSVASFSDELIPGINGGYVHRYPSSCEPTKSAVESKKTELIPKTKSVVESEDAVVPTPTWE